MRKAVRYAVTSYRMSSGEAAVLCTALGVVSGMEGIDMRVQLHL